MSGRFLGFDAEIRINDLYSGNTLKARRNPRVSGTPDLTSCSKMLINACQHGGLFIGSAVLTISILNGRKIHVQTPWKPFTDVSSRFRPVHAHTRTKELLPG